MIIEKRFDYLYDYIHSKLTLKSKLYIVMPSFKIIERQVYYEVQYYACDVFVPMVSHLKDRSLPLIKLFSTSLGNVCQFPNVKQFVEQNAANDRFLEQL